MTWSAEEICQILDVEKNSQNPIIKGFSIDSRTCQEGDIFVALKTVKRDGHAFVEDAVQNGAVAAIIDAEYKLNNSFQEKISIIRVEDVLQALHYVALKHRQKYCKSVLAVTGSNGKTTTKDWIAHLLQDQIKVACSKKNFNNQIGVPLSILSIKNKVDLAVLEFGMNSPGEISNLCKMVEPNKGLIANIGNAHIGFFDDVVGVARAKNELFEWLDNFSFETNMFVNSDDELLMNLMKDRERHQYVSFAINIDADINARQINFKNNKTYFVLYEQGHCVGEASFPLVGEHHVRNALAAIAVARNWGMEWKNIIKKVKTFPLPHHRGNVKSMMGWTLIDDSYNANPQSMSCSLESFANLECKGKKYFVCGEMLELGKFVDEEHVRLGEKIACSNIDGLYTFGSKAILTQRQAFEGGMKKSFHFNNQQDLSQQLKNDLSNGDCLLIKGSRSNCLENIINELEKQ